ncbi:MAG: ATPase [Armatimonadetes bacterium]|nr:ATPase [Armatimonadota bacterium]
MPYFIAIDGGQTSTLAILADEAGHILGAGLGGPTNHIHEPGAKERLWNALHDSITRAFEKAGIPLTRLQGVGMGISGSGVWAEKMVQQLCGADVVAVAGDGMSSLAGATVCKPGVIIIAGTGAAAFGINAEGRQLSASGWGYVMGDEGSGYWIARRALSAATKSLDGRAPATALSEMIPAHFGLESLRTLHAKIYAFEIERPGLAAISGVVGMAAGEGDAVARRILEEAAQELALSAAAVLKGLDMPGAAPEVAPIGGVFKAGSLILEPLRAALHLLVPDARLIEPRFPPVIGALFLAYRKAGIALEEPLLERVRAGVEFIKGVK